MDAKVFKIVFWIWFGLLLAPSFAYDLITTQIPPQATLLSLCSITFAWALLRGNPKWLFFIFLPAYAWLPFEVYYIVRYKSPTDAHIFSIIHETHTREAFEYFGPATLITGIALCITFIALTLILAFKSPKQLPQEKTLRLAILFSLLGFLPHALGWAMQPSHGFNPDEPLHDLNPQATPFTDDIKHSYPFGLILRLADFNKQKKAIQDAFDYINKNPPQVITQEAKDIHIFLVIGESSNPKHWQIHGYTRTTNPLLSQMSGIFPLNNVISPYSATRLAVPAILLGDKNPSPKKHSIIQVFKSSGFNIFWLSNQAPIGPHDSIIAMHAHSANKYIFINPASYNKPGTLDGDLLEPLKKTIQNDPEKKLVVIHLLGSHRAYQHRYPNQFDIFKPSLKSNQDSTHETILNTYDNSIRYTDFILSEIINSIKNLPSILIYVSDHGENIPNTFCQDEGHGHQNADDFLVSSFVWLSEHIMTQYPKWPEELEKRKNLPLQTTDIFHTLLDMAGITLKDRHQPERSWIYPKWIQRPRWTQAVDDFDQATRELPCETLKMPH